MKTTISAGTMLMLCGLCLNAVAAEPLVQAQQPDHIISLPGQHKLQDGKQPDRSAHRTPGEVIVRGNDAAPSADDDC